MSNFNPNLTNDDVVSAEVAALMLLASAYALALNEGDNSNIDLTEFVRNNRGLRILHNHAYMAFVKENLTEAEIADLCNKAAQYLENQMDIIDEINNNRNAFIDDMLNKISPDEG